MAERISRDLLWEGCFNVRDLGGYRTVDGRETRRGAVVRSDAPDRLSVAGRAALAAHGIRTVVDLRDRSERPELHRDGLATVHVPVIDFSDEEFWREWRGVWDSRRFYPAILARWPERFAAAVGAVARAEDGGVLVHCRSGRDRTGLVAALLLALVGVPPDAIADDYALSASRLEPLYRELLAAADERERRRLRQENVSDPHVMLGVLADLDVRGYLLDGGLTLDDLGRIERRLLADPRSVRTVSRPRPR